MNSLQKNIEEIKNEIIVIDNGSNDGSQKMLMNEFSYLKIILNPENVGFSKANNQALNIAKGENVLCLNPDTVVHDDAVIKSLRTLKTNLKIGALGCLLMKDGSEIQESWDEFPSLSSLIKKHFVIKKRRNIYVNSGISNLVGDSSGFLNVDWILGAFLLIKRELLISLGGFDEDYFLYGEDLDLCYRIHKKGLNVSVYTGAKITHFGNKTWGVERIKRVYHAYFLFYKKHFDLLRLIFLRLALGIYRLFVLLGSILEVIFRRKKLKAIKENWELFVFCMRPRL